MEKNLPVVREYLDYLKERYKLLQKDPYSFKARLALKNEIENMNQVLEEEKMAERFDALDKAFGMGKPSPKTVFSEKDKASKFMNELAADPVTDK